MDGICSAKLQQPQLNLKETNGKFTGKKLEMCVFSLSDCSL